MGHAAGELADHLHFLRFDKLVLQMLVLLAKAELFQGLMDRRPTAPAGLERIRPSRPASSPPPAISSPMVPETIINGISRLRVFNNSSARSPLNSGMVWSHSMRSSPPLRLARNAASVSTRREVVSNPERFNSCKIILGIVWIIFDEQDFE